MEKRLFLLGDIGCGKSTMIRKALGDALHRAGGFLTVRAIEENRCIGYDLTAPDGRSGRFCSLEDGVRRDDSVFSELGVELLQSAPNCAFAVADEFGGIELLVPEFREALYAFLQSDVPCIGVLKNTNAAKAMERKIPLGEEYARHLQQLRTMLEQDSDTLLLKTTGWQDKNAAEILRQWAEEYL